MSIFVSLSLSCIYACWCALSLPPSALQSDVSDMLQSARMFFNYCVTSVVELTLPVLTLSLGSVVHVSAHVATTKVPLDDRKHGQHTGDKNGHIRSLYDRFCYAPFSSNLGSVTGLPPGTVDAPFRERSFSCFLFCRQGHTEGKANSPRA